jgi:hypothetical protein
MHTLDQAYPPRNVRLLQKIRLRAMGAINMMNHPIQIE